MLTGFAFFMIGLTLWAWIKIALAACALALGTNITATTYDLIGVEFQIGDGATPTENFTTIVQVDSCDFGGSKTDVEEVTSADNTDNVKRKADRQQDHGQCSVEIWWNPADPTHQQLHNAWIARGTHNFKRVLAGNAGTRTFNGIITSFDQKEVIGKGTKKMVKIDINGPITYSAPAV